MRKSSVPNHEDIEFLGLITPHYATRYVDVALALPRDVYSEGFARMPRQDWEGVETHPTRNRRVRKMIASHLDRLSKSPQVV